MAGTSAPWGSIAGSEEAQPIEKAREVFAGSSKDGHRVTTDAEGGLRRQATDGMLVDESTPIALIERDGATSEIRSPARGQLRWLVAEGVEVEAGTELAEILPQ